MLVLTRKKEQSIILGNEIEITVIGIDGDQVKLGIKAPKNVEIYRKEVYITIQEENKQAASQQFSKEVLEQLIKQNDK